MAMSCSPPRLRGRGEGLLSDERPSRTRLPRLEGDGLDLTQGSGNGPDHDRVPGRLRVTGHAAAGHAAGRSSSERRQRMDAIKRSRRRRHANEDVSGEWNDLECRRKWEEVRREHAQRREQERVERLLSDREPLPPDKVPTTHLENLPSSDAPLGGATGLLSQTLTGQNIGQLPQLNSKPAQEAIEPTPPSHCPVRPRLPASPRPPVGATPHPRPLVLQRMPPNQASVMPKNVRLQEIATKPASPPLEISQVEPQPSRQDLMCEHSLSIRDAQQDIVPLAVSELAERRSPAEIVEQSMLRSSSRTKPISLKPSTSDKLLHESQNMADLDEDDADQPIGGSRPHGIAVCSSPLLQWTGDIRRTSSIAGSSDIQEIKCDPEPAELSGSTAEHSAVVDSITPLQSCSALQRPAVPVAPVMPLPEGHFVRKGLMQRQTDRVQSDELDREAAAAVVIQSSQRCRQARKELAVRHASCEEQYHKTSRNAAEEEKQQQSAGMDLQRHSSNTSVQQLKLVTEHEAAIKLHAVGLGASSKHDCQSMFGDDHDVLLRRQSLDRAMESASRYCANALVTQAVSEIEAFRHDCVFDEVCEIDPWDIDMELAAECAAVNMVKDTLIESKDLCHQEAPQHPTMQLNYMCAEEEKGGVLIQEETRKQYTAEAAIQLPERETESNLVGRTTNMDDVASQSSLGIAEDSYTDAAGSQFDVLAGLAKDFTSEMIDMASNAPSQACSVQNSDISGVPSSIVGHDGNFCGGSNADMMEKESTVTSDADQVTNELAEALMSAVGHSLHEIADEASTMPELSKSSALHHVAVNKALDAEKVVSSADLPESVHDLRVRAHNLLMNAFSSEQLETALKQVLPEVSAQCDDMPFPNKSNEMILGNARQTSEDTKLDGRLQQALAEVAAVQTQEVNAKNAETLRSGIAEVLLTASSNGSLQQAVAGVTHADMQEAHAKDLDVLRKSLRDALMFASSTGTLQQTFSEVLASSSIHNSDRLEALRTKAYHALLSASVDGALQQAVCEVSADRSGSTGNAAGTLPASTGEVLQSASFDGALHKTFVAECAGSSENKQKDLNTLRREVCDVLFNASSDGTLKQVLSEQYAKSSEHVAHYAEIPCESAAEVFQTASLDGASQQALVTECAGSLENKQKDLNTLRKEVFGVLLNASSDGTLQRVLSEGYAKSSKHMTHNAGTLCENAVEVFQSTSLDGTLQQVASSDSTLHHTIPDLHTDRSERLPGGMSCSLRKKAFEAIRNASFDGTLHCALSEVHADGSKRKARSNTVHDPRLSGNEAGESSWAVAEVCASSSCSHLDAALNTSIDRPLEQPEAESSNIGIRSIHALCDHACNGFQIAARNGTLQRALSQLYTDRSKQRPNHNATHFCGEIGESDEQRGVERIVQHATFDTQKQSSSSCTHASFERASVSEDTGDVRESAKNALLWALEQGTLENAIQVLCADKREANEHILDADDPRFDTQKQPSSSCTHASFERASVSEDAGDVRESAKNALIWAFEQGTLEHAIQVLCADKREANKHSLDADDLRAKTRCLAFDSFNSGILEETLDNLKSEMQQDTLLLRNTCDTEIANSSISEDDQLLEGLGEVIDSLDEAGGEQHKHASTTGAQSTTVHVNEDGFIQADPLDLSLDFLDQDLLAADNCDQDAPATQNMDRGKKGSLGMKSSWEELVEAECHSRLGVLLETGCLGKEDGDTKGNSNKDVLLSDAQLTSEQRAKENSAGDRPNGVENFHEMQPAELGWPSWLSWRTIHDRMSERLSTPLGLRHEEELNGHQDTNEALVSPTAASVTSCSIAAPTKPASHLAVEPASEANCNNQCVSTSWVRQHWSILRRPETSRPSSRASNDSPQQNFQELTSLAAFKRKLAGVSNEGVLGSTPAPRDDGAGEGNTRAKEPEAFPQASTIKNLPPPPDFDPPVCLEAMRQPFPMGIL